MRLAPPAAARSRRTWPGKPNEVVSRSLMPWARNWASACVKRHAFRQQGFGAEKVGVAGQAGPAQWIRKRQSDVPSIRAGYSGFPASQACTSGCVQACSMATPCAPSGQEGPSCSSMRDRLPCPQRRNRVGGAHACQAQGLVGRPELPDGLQLRQRSERARRSAAAARRRGQARAWRLSHAYQPAHPGRPATRPAGWRARRPSSNWHSPGWAATRQPVRLGRLGVVAIAVRRQPDGAPALLRYQRGDAENELAGAAASSHAPHVHAMKLRPAAGAKRCSWRPGSCVASAWLHGGQRGRARPAGIAVGGKVVQRARRGDRGRRERAGWRAGLSS